MQKLSIHYFKKKEINIILYIFYGICTTFLNIIIYWLVVYLLGAGTMFGTIVAWILSVLFAYVTNRKYVFGSEAVGARAVGKEMSSFFLSRLITGMADWTCMFVFVSMLNINDIFIKSISNIGVIILNFIVSKWIVFRKKERRNEEFSS